ncbi:unnamed protein product [Cyclocybe aegerita]|uniref:Rad51-like C-terminal domain-containing protein n=1 Tax=Cyclocybe aegerita TaxID=1973307 RepID=A0A8S0W240_CYCAE|nr:unnamed protein product [Cyclocybe aegerita]
MHSLCVQHSPWLDSCDLDLSESLLNIWLRFLCPSNNSSPMRLANLVPSIPAQLVASLEAIGIRTETELLLSTSTLDIFRRLPAGTTTLQALIEVASLVASLCAAPSLSAYELLILEEHARKQQRPLCSGNEALDDLLRGLSGGRVIEISGDKGSGKSVLALNIVVQHLATYPDSNVVWIDTMGDFSAEIAVQILNSKQVSSRVLERLHVSLAFDTDSAQTLLDDLVQATSVRSVFLSLSYLLPLNSDLGGFRIIHSCLYLTL